MAKSTLSIYVPQQLYSLAMAAQQEGRLDIKTVVKEALKRELGIDDHGNPITHPEQAVDMPDENPTQPEDVTEGSAVTGTLLTTFPPAGRTTFDIRTFETLIDAQAYIDNATSSGGYPISLACNPINHFVVLMSWPPGI